ncbi:hypothetical protein SAMN02982989_3206 [Xaviernesmea oryzae]|uniref:Uncharacterized protein n=1 Tax=Xaviernesmea oryzae TaxID=464029 RepID=A0A1X7FJT9_9HYPH|nr:hypothetical protein [Xaviernesmea oryzae]SMF53473.1 hypothetical protein SAMN02982989_3206 [Xaviernesmea oryzae]
MSFEGCWATLRDVPDEAVQIACTVCPRSETFPTADLRKKFDPETYIWHMVTTLTSSCRNREPYSGAVPCGAYTEQGKSAMAAIHARQAKANEEASRAALEREETARQREERARNAEIRVAERNGWKMFDAIPAGTKPKYRWQQSWEDEYPEDIIGFDGTRPIGRVFRFEPHVTNKDVWFWVLYGVEERRRKRPGQGFGWEASRLMAACRVEWCYKKMLQEERQEAKNKREA